MRRQPSPLLLVALLGVGCNKGPSEAELDALWSMEPVYGVPNVDDDDSDGVMDWMQGEDALPDGENELFTVTIPADMVDSVGKDGQIKVSLSGPDVRVWKGGKLWLSDGDSKTLQQQATLEVEFGDFLAAGTLTLKGVDKKGEAVAQATVALQAAPLLLNNHRQYAERVIAMSYTGIDGNQAFVEGFKDVLGDDFIEASVRDYGWDVWVQDEIEFATLSSPDHELYTVIDSIRSKNGRGLDDLPEEIFEAPDFARLSWEEDSGRANSQDSFGNMEVSPPVTVNGVEYPFGRIYWGEWFGEGPKDDNLTATLKAQRVQAPFQLDVSFLCVGHVDEFTTFVPDPTSDKGFRLIITDVEEAYAFLDTLDPELAIPPYEEYKGYATIQDILDDADLRSLNEEIQEDYLVPNLAILKAELGLTDDDIIKLPMLFERVEGCGGTTATFFPGTVNMTVVQRVADGDTTHVFMADPFLRPTQTANDASREDDPFIRNVEALLPANLEPHWLDDWDWYHMQLGEVHCGSNTVRTPAAPGWWEVAMHLINTDDTEGVAR